MTTANDTPTEGETELDADQLLQEEGRTPTESLLGPEEGEAVDDADREAAMLAGFSKVSGAKKEAATDNDDDNGVKNTPANDDGNGDVVTDDGSGDKTRPAQPQDDPEIPGLGKASEIRARLNEVDSLRKQLASTSGHLGHLKQLVTSAGKGKAVTADALKNVAEEFGPEFADALAKDLSSAGFGSGSSLDSAAVQAMVAEQVERATEQTRRTSEKKAVLRTHKDADDYFSRQKMDAQGNPVMAKDDAGNEVPVWEPGPKHEVLTRYVQTLPADRQQELQTNGWDSDVIIRLLDEVKAHEKKAANQQAMQSARVTRAAAPTTGAGQRVEQPADPLMDGWNKVRGNRAGRAAMAGRR